MLTSLTVVIISLYIFKPSCYTTQIYTIFYHKISNVLRALPLSPPAGQVLSRRRLEDGCQLRGPVKGKHLVIVIFAGAFQRTEEPDGLQAMGSPRVGHN